MKKIILMVTILMCKVLIAMIIMSNISFAKTYKVGLIDTGVYPLNAEIKNQTIKLNDVVKDFHGTSLACILTHNKDIVVHNLEHYNTFDGRISALKEAIKIEVDYILYTSSGDDESKKEKFLIEYAIKKGIKVVVSSGNNKKDLNIEKEYPCSYAIDGLICIGNSKDYSNKGTNVLTVEEDFDHRCLQSLKGTSQSAAIYLRDLIKN